MDGSPVVGAGVRNEAPNAAVGAGMRAKQAFRAEKHHHVWRGLPEMVRYCIINNRTGPSATSVAQKTLQKGRWRVGWQPGGNAVRASTHVRSCVLHMAYSRSAAQAATGPNGEGKNALKLVDPDFIICGYVVCGVYVE